MTDLELLTDWLNDVLQQIRTEVKDLTPAELAWYAPGDPDANNIGVTVWHVARWADVLAFRILRDAPAEAELWHTQGWRAKTNYDPRGIGYRGLGAITDYTPAEVKAIPSLSADELLMYLDQAGAALKQALLALPAGGLYQPSPGLGGKHPTYTWVKAEWQGFFGHIGEIQALKASYARALKDKAQTQ